MSIFVIVSSTKYSLGWRGTSFGYHGDDGHKFSPFVPSSTGLAFGPTYDVGDTVGCGYDPKIGAIFYTLNGDFIGKNFHTLTKSIYL
jgi:hypothetical protein